MDSQNANQELEKAPQLTKEEVVKQLQAILEKVDETPKSEIESLKQGFYKIHNAELKQTKDKFIAEGGNEFDFKPASDELEDKFKDLMNEIKKVRAQLAEKLEKQKEENLSLKLAIIDKLKAIVESNDDVNKNYNEVKELQQKWNEIKLIPQSKVKETWNSYQANIEKFYDLVKLNNEFRDYDFKKNLEIKTHLCETAEALSKEQDVVSAFHQLQKLHQEFRETGPIAKELREDIWTRFKAASTVVNKRHQDHFEALKDQEDKNLALKTEICELTEGISLDTLKSFGEWNEKTKEIIELQARWKKIGFAPQKMNVKIFERFRKACDNFFEHKSTFFKEMKEAMAENLAKKEALCEKAEALKENTDWKKTSEKLIQLQKEWKKVGPVTRKYSDVVWKRFIAACDYFFDQRNKANATQHSAEADNLKAKKALIDKLSEIYNKDQSELKDLNKIIKDIIKEWNTIGHVPYKEKDKVYAKFHELIDSIYDKFNLNLNAQKISNFKDLVENEKDNKNHLFRERDKLMRISENMKNEIITYENNLGFLSSSSQKGNSLVTEMNRKVEKLKSDLNVIKEKIQIIENSIQ